MQMRSFPLHIHALVLLAALITPAGAPGADGPGEPLLSRTRQLTFEGRRSGEGYFDARGGRLVFQSEREPENPFFQIYLLDLESGDTRRVSTGTGKTTCAWLHPSGERVLFASTHLDAEAIAKQQQELEERASGVKRRYAWDYDPNYDLFASDLAGGALTRLTDAWGYDAEGSYSPDGALVAFASNRHAYEEALPEEDRALFASDPAAMMEIYVMKADGSDVRRITHARGYDGGPFFSPDGTRIVWRRFAENGATAEIFTMDLAGGDVRRLTSLGVLSWAPYYHPSGEYVVFATNRHGFANFELYLVDTDGTREPVRVTDSPGFDGLPVFSPDGATLSWTSGRGSGGKSQLFLAHWDHEAARRLLAGPPARAVTPPAPAEPTPADEEITTAELRAHVAALTDEAMQGRATGSEGERRATDYVARAFSAAGLEPDGDDDGFFHRFTFTAGLSPGPGNELRVTRGETRRSFQANEQWRPLAFSRTGEGEGEAVFAGYGIVAAASDEFPAYDSYGDLEVEGKWVLALRFLPEDVSPERRQHLNRYASLRHKAMIARDRGALGLLVASGPTSQVRDPLIALRPDASVGAMSLLAASVSDALAAELLEGSGRELETLQRELDGGEATTAFALEGVRIEATLDLLQETREGRNVLARLPSGEGADRPALVIGAHVDHLGQRARSTSLARDEERSQIHPGADDNASGVAALVEIAGQLASLARREPGLLQRDLVFAAWSGEELGLLGSAAWTKALPDVHEVAHGAPRTIAAYLNMDMVGRLQERLLLQGVGSSGGWPAIIERSNVPVGLPVALQNDSYLPTDATSFYLKGVPVLSAFTGSHAEYHTPRDTPDRLDYEGLRDVARLVASVARNVASRADLLDYVAFERPEEIAPRAGLRAYLGTIPSYGGSEDSGVTLSGVAGGGPAEAAGVRGGDRIVRLAGRTVENIYDYTYAIEALKVGEPVQLVVVRDGEHLTLEVTPGSRE